MADFFLFDPGRARREQPNAGLHLGVRAFVRSVSHVKVFLLVYLDFFETLRRSLAVRAAPLATDDDDELTTNDERHNTGANRAHIWALGTCRPSGGRIPAPWRGARPVAEDRPRRAKAVVE